MKIEELDANMKIEALTRTDIAWYSPLEAPFTLHGVFFDDVYRRVPKDVAEATSEGVAALATNTAGGRVRFCTDSPFVAVHAEMKEVCRMNHMAFSGIFGFDCYTEKGFAGPLRGSVDMKDGFESEVPLPNDGKLHTVTIGFPLYNNVDKLLIGVKEGSRVEAAAPYTYEKPVVYYGSSITQGGCASRPGTSYQAFVSRKLDCDYINLGFSGNAKGEKAITDYIASLPMSVFVMDYDHNAPTAEHLAATHEPMFQAIRRAQPDLPVIFVTKPDVWLHEAQARVRRDIIYATYSRAVAAGDQNVAFIDGSTLFAGEGWQDCTVDGCHPTDLGFFRMAQVIGNEVAKRLK